MQILANEKNPKVRRLFLYTFAKNKKFIKALRTLCKNTVKGKLNLSNKEKEKISKHLKEIKFFSIKKNSSKSKLVQNGAGFLAALIPIAAAILGPLIDGAFKKNDDGPVRGKMGGKTS